MHKKTITRDLVIGIICFFMVGIIVPLGTSSSITTPSTEVPQDINACGTPIWVDDQSYYVMSSIPPLPPESESSPPLAQLGPLPAEFSWKNYNGGDYTTSAKNQGYCGSCWDFASVGAIEAVINVRSNNPDIDMDLSEQYVLSCLPQTGSCDGGSSDQAFKYIKSNKGIIPEDCMPYEARDDIPCSAKCPDWQDKLVPVKSYGAWYPNFPTDRDRIKNEIMQRGPIVTYFFATNDFAEFGSTHHSPNDYYPYHQHDSLNHAVVFVGWKDDQSIGNGGYWIVKNSWGEDWGYDGFFNIEYGSLNIDNYFITWADFDTNSTFSMNITTPKPGSVYVFGNELFTNYSTTAIFGGPFTIAAFARDFVQGIEKVEFSLNNIPAYTALTSPYEWRLDTRHIGTYTLTITAYNNQGGHLSKEMSIFILYLGIL